MQGVSLAVSILLAHALPMPEGGAAGATNSSPPGAVAQVATPADEVALSDTARELLAAELWTARLGDDAPRMRDRAERILLSIGTPALAAVERAIKSTDPELRRRARKLSLTLRWTEFQRRSTWFTERPLERSPDDIPGWKAFSARVGTDSHARSLFAAMLRSEPELIWTHAMRREVLPERFAERSEAMFRPAVHDGLVAADENSELSEGEAAVLLFIGSDPGVELPETVGEIEVNDTMLFLVIESTPTISATEQTPRGKLLKGLVGDWLTLRSMENVFSSLTVARNLRLDDVARKIARATIRNGRADPMDLSLAATTLEEIGDRADVPALTALLSNEDECDTAQLGDALVTRQVRDAALAALIRLANLRPTAFGFEARSDFGPLGVVLKMENEGPAVHFFRTNEHREVGFRRWKQTTPVYRDQPSVATRGARAESPRQDK